MALMLEIVGGIVLGLVILANLETVIPIVLALAGLGIAGFLLLVAPTVVAVFLAAIVGLFVFTAWHDSKDIWATRIADYRKQTRHIVGPVAAFASVILATVVALKVTTVAASALLPVLVVLDKPWVAISAVIGVTIGAVAVPVSTLVLLARAYFTWRAGNPN